MPALMSPTGISLIASLELPRVSAQSNLLRGRPSSRGSDKPTTMPTTRGTVQPSLRLRDFARAAWHVVEPHRTFVPNWHLDVIAEHLEAVTRGELRNLVINMPPRSMKSLSVSVFWPAWEWTFQPWVRWLYGSYAAPLAIRDAVRTRRLLSSPWFLEQEWAAAFHLTGDQNVKSRYDNDSGGWRIATSVKGGGTGEGGDRIVSDDAAKTQEAESALAREAVATWWGATMSTRSDDPSRVSRVIVMQRIHEGDLTGLVLEEGGYHHLVLPMEYEPVVTILAGVDAAQEIRPHTDCQWGSDPRTVEGELLWPGRIDAAAVSDLKIRLGPYGASGQLQQRPSPKEGSLFKDAYFSALPLDYDEPGEGGKTFRQRLVRVQMWDTAESLLTSADYTAAVTLGVDRQGRLFIEDVLRKRVAERALDLEIAEHILRTRPHIVGIEERAFKQKETQDLVRRVYRRLAKAGEWSCGVVPVPVHTDKVVRAQPALGRGQAGLLYADRQAPWWPTFRNEVLRFPLGSHDDQVDALSGAVQLAVTGTAHFQQAQDEPTSYTLGKGGEFEDERPMFSGARFEPAEDGRVKLLRRVG